MIQHPRSSPSSVVLHPFFLSSLLLSLRPNSPHTPQSSHPLACLVSALHRDGCCASVCVCTLRMPVCVLCAFTSTLSAQYSQNTFSPPSSPPATRCLSLFSSFFPSPDVSHPSILTPPFTLSVDSVAPPPLLGDHYLMRTFVSYPPSSPRRL